MSVAESYVFCRKLAKTHYENFTVVSFLLPRQLRDPFYTVYAYCRISDDLADESATPQIALQKLDTWGKELDRCFAGATLPSDSPIFVALRDVSVRHALEKKPFSDLLVAFRRDQIQNRYETLDELLDYCRFSADPVGRIILALGESVRNRGNRPTREMLQYSDSICTGLQLANFWQDVARDWQKNRFYIPMSLCREFGYDVIDEKLHYDKAFAKMLRFLVDDARKRLTFGKPLIQLVPRFLATDIALFINGGLAVLDMIERIDYNVLKERPSLSKWKKLQLFLKYCLKSRT